MKRGTVSDRLCGKVSRQCIDEKALRPEYLITPASTRQMYNIYEQSFKEHKIHEVLYAAKETHFSMRLNLIWSRIQTFRTSKPGGFTAYRAIQAAKKGCPAFPWQKFGEALPA